MLKVAVIGAGRVGSVIARDLADDSRIAVTIADCSADRLQSLQQKINFTPIVADLTDSTALTRVMAGQDLIVGALPGALGRQVLERVIDAGKHCVDISFMAEDPRGFDAKARAKGARVIYDFGIAPGMSNLLAAVEANRLKQPGSVKIYVGGLPTVRRLPWEYSAPFSPADVVEEYIRPARIRQNGRTVVCPPLSGVESIDVPGIGTLEAFLSDGLRSLVDTVDCPDMAELTLRYPGHRDRIKLLADAGFFGTEPVLLNGTAVAPLALTRTLLDTGWRPDADAEEFTVMQVVVEGVGDRGSETAVWQLLDRTDPVRGESSMARTTGFPVAILVRELFFGALALPAGVHPPDRLASEDGFVRTLLDELANRGVRYTRSSDV